MITQVDFENSIQDAFLEYGASVAQERAIADVRDGLKIGLRQGLYAQYTNKLTHNKPYKKALKSVAAATSQSYVHGDKAIYDTFVRMAKPWAARYLLEDAQGAVGSPCAPDDHTASRYLEMRASELSDIFFDGLKKNAIGDEWYNNYDDTEKIPSVFPSIGFWNIVNGCTGIAVAMSTNIPQFNLKEVNQALIKLIQNKDINFDEIYCPPDFATGGTITNAKEVKESLEKGKGASIRLRADLTYNQKDNVIIASHLPYGVYTNTVIGQLASLTEEDENYGIAKVIDHTKKEADIRIYLTKAANPTVMIQKLYKDTSLESWFGINMIMLDHGRFPKVFGWREACQAYIDHIRECKKRELQYDLDALVARNHILEGLLIAIAHIDEVVALIRHSESAADAKQALMKNYNLDEEQAKAILDLKLQRLANLEAIKINKELEENQVEIDKLNNILSNPLEIDKILINILDEVAKKFGDARRTKITNIINADEEEEEEIPVIVRIKDGKISLCEKLLSGQNIKTTNKDILIGFAANGKMYKVAIKELTDKQIAISTLFKTRDIIAINSVSSLKEGGIITFITKDGYVKKTKMSEYSWPARANTVSFKLQQDDVIRAIDFNDAQEFTLKIGDKEQIINCKNYKILPSGKQAKGKKVIQENEQIDSVIWSV